MPIYSEFSQSKWWFSIALLVYQRVSYGDSTKIQHKNTLIPEFTRMTTLFTKESWYNDGNLHIRRTPETWDRYPRPSSGFVGKVLWVSAEDDQEFGTQSIPCWPTVFCVEGHRFSTLPHECKFLWRWLGNPRATEMLHNRKNLCTFSSKISKNTV